MEKEDISLKLKPDSDLRFDFPEKLKRRPIPDFDGTYFDYRCISAAEGDSQPLNEEEASEAQKYINLKLKYDENIVMPGKSGLKHTGFSFRHVSSIAAIVIISLLLYYDKKDKYDDNIVICPVYVSSIDPDKNFEILPVNPVDNIVRNRKVKKKKPSPILDADNREEIEPKIEKIFVSFEPVAVEIKPTDNPINVSIVHIEARKIDTNETKTISYAINYIKDLLTPYNKNLIDSKIAEFIANDRPGELEICSIRHGKATIVQEFDKNGNAIKTKIISPKPINLNLDSAYE